MIQIQYPKTVDDKEWLIITPEFKSEKCENEVNNSRCGSSEKVLWLRTETKRLYIKKTLYVCAKCAKKDYNIVGEWTKTWKKEFKWPIQKYEHK